MTITRAITAAMYDSDVKAPHALVSYNGHPSLFHMKQVPVAWQHDLNHRPGDVVLMIVPVIVSMISQ